MISDKPWIASAPHPQTKATTIVNPQGRVIAALVPNVDDAAFICEARNRPSVSMSADEYQQLAGRTLIDGPDAAYSPADIMLVWNALGLAGEAGEVADTVKKAVFHQHGVDREELIKELGDVLWYVAALCTTRSQRRRADFARLCSHSAVWPRSARRAPLMMQL